MSDETNVTDASDNTEQAAETTESTTILSTETSDSTDSTDSTAEKPVETEKVDTSQGENEAEKPEANEDKPLLAQDGDGEAEKAETEDAEKDPIVYTDFELPEGFELDKGLADAALPLLAELGVDQSGAQKIVSAVTELNKSRAEQAQNEAQEQTKATVDAWKKSITDDPNYAENLKLSQKGTARILKEVPELATLFNDPVFGNMPELFKIAQFVGKNFESEAELLDGSNVANNSKSFLEKMYDNTGE